MRILKKSFAGAILFTLLITGYTVYVLLDTFVIERSYTAVAPNAHYGDTSPSEESVTEEAPTDASGETIPADVVPTEVLSTDMVSTEASKEAVPQVTPTATPSVIPTPTPTVTPTATPKVTPQGTPAVAEKTPDYSYNDKNITISLNTVRKYNTNIYVAQITLSDAKFLRTAFAKNTYGKNVTAKTSATAQSNNAILAVNGDYYGARESGYVIRGGVIYRDKEASSNQQDAVIYNDGTIGIISEKDVTAQELIEQGARDVFSFGPALLSGGSIMVNEKTEVKQAGTSNPRTAIGMIDKLHYIILVSDGRTDASEGLSLYTLAEYMKSLGVKEAYNLDGGGSSTMYFNGSVINVPTTNGKSVKERSVSDIVYIGY